MNTEFKGYTYLNDKKRTALINKIYNSIMNRPEMDMDNMGEAMEEAANIVDSWAAENDIKFYTPKTEQP